jgi:tetratricopeptide (TPR) repeat protein
MRYLANKALAKNYLDGQAYAINQLGRKYRNTSQFTRALALHQRALEIAEESGNLEFEVYAHNMLGVVYNRSDAIQAALNYYQRALELAETVENPNIGLKRSMNVSLNGIGNIYKTLEQFEVAIDKFEQALILDKVMNNKLGLAVNHFNIGECQESLGQLEEALHSFHTSLSYNNEINSARGKILCDYSIAHVYVHMGKTEEANDMLQDALSKAKELGDNSIISSIEINLGWALLNLKRYKQAKEHLDNGLRIAQDINLPSQIAEANKFLSDLAIAQNDYESALDYYKKSESFDKEIANVRNLRYVNDIIMRYESEKSTKELKKLSDEHDEVKQELVKNRTRLLISGIAIALLAGILYILYRQYQLKNEKKLLTLEQSMLRSQMNPHFLFNSLNSIKLYIINNEQKNAVHYLNKFSKLIRKILEASSLKEIPLADELETVELYMNIENIRFSNEINFDIIIAEGIDPHTIKIPSLILQPFLENALWHGLSSKEGDKNIVLEISKGKIGGFIDIAIIDNGIGRNAAETIKQNKVLKRKSVGIDITKERLSNFSRDYQNSFELEILDLYDEAGKASGTKVLLHIPTF